LINQLRGVLLERGIAFPRGRRKLELRLETMTAEEAVSITSGTRLLIDDMRAEWRPIRSASLDHRMTTRKRRNGANAPPEQMMVPTVRIPFPPPRPPERTLSARSPGR
jgi:hypothetical protein